MSVDGYNGRQLRIGPRKIGNEGHEWPLWTEITHDKPRKIISKLKYRPKGMQKSRKTRGCTQDTKQDLKGLIKRMHKKPRQKVIKWQNKHGKIPQPYLQTRRNQTIKLTKHTLNKSNINETNHTKATQSRSSLSLKTHNTKNTSHQAQERQNSKWKTTTAKHNVNNIIILCLNDAKKQ